MSEDVGEKDSGEKIFPNGTGKPEKEEGILEKWKSIPLADLVDKGWIPRVRTKKGTKYMSLRLGQQEKGLGVYTEKKLNFLMEMFPKLKETMKSPQDKVGKKKASILDIPIGKSADIPKKYVPGLPTLAYFKYFKEKGLPVDFSQFVDEIIIEHCENCFHVTWAVVHG